MTAPFLRYKVYEISVYKKKYIGCTAQLPANRLQQHLEYCHAVGKTHNHEFYSSLLAWQWQYKSTPIMKLLYQSDNHVHALLMEVKMIRDLNTQVAGWNLSPGGETRDFHVKDRATPEDVEFIFGKDDRYFYKIFNKNWKDNNPVVSGASVPPKPFAPGGAVVSGKTINNHQQTTNDGKNSRFLANKFFSAYQFEFDEQKNFYKNTSRSERKRILQKFKKEGTSKKMNKLITNYVKRNIL